MNASDPLMHWRIVFCCIQDQKLMTLPMILLPLVRNAIRINLNATSCLLLASAKTSGRRIQLFTLGKMQAQEQAQAQAQVQALYHLVGIVRAGHDEDGDHDGDGNHGGQKSKDFDLKCISPHIIV
jgi:hypothetical protein